jgi:hypothetical protein
MIAKHQNSLRTVQTRGPIAAHSAPQHAAIRRFHDAAERRARAATALGDDRYMPVALGLSAEAGRCYAAAFLLACDPAFDPGDLDGAALFGRIDAIVANGTIEPPPDGYRVARDIFLRHAPLTFDDLPTVDAIAARETIDHTLQWLRDLVEPRTPGELRRAAIARIATAVAATIACALVLFWLVSLALRPPNVALKRPATASSQSPGIPSLTGVTNGQIESTFGIATTSEKDPWIRVDLEDAYRISTVTVHQRADGSHAQGFPMSIELSQNDKDWIEIGYRKDPSASDWTVASKRRARYVRVRSFGTRVLALTEIEVLGSR